MDNNAKPTKPVTPEEMNQTMSPVTRGPITSFFSKDAEPDLRKKLYYQIKALRQSFCKEYENKPSPMTESVLLLIYSIRMEFLLDFKYKVAGPAKEQIMFALETSLRIQVALNQNPLGTSGVDIQNGRLSNAYKVWTAGYTDLAREILLQQDSSEPIDLKYIQGEDDNHNHLFQSNWLSFVIDCMNLQKQPSSINSPCRSPIDLRMGTKCPK